MKTHFISDVAITVSVSVIAEADSGALSLDVHKHALTNRVYSLNNIL